jgi:hypothetical protein
LQPTHPGAAAGPLTLEESCQRRWRRPAAVVEEETTPAPAPTAGVPGPLSAAGAGMVTPGRRSRIPVDVTLVRQVLGQRRRVVQPPVRPPGTFESRWYHSFACPLRLWWLVLVLAASLTVLSGGAVLWLSVADDGTESARTLHEVIGTAGGIAALIVFVFAASLFDGVLTSAVSGGLESVHWPARNVPRMFWCATRWLVGLLAGPGVIAFGGFYYWLHAGELDVIDRVILGEIVLVAVGYWMFAQLAISRKKRLRDVQPLRVAEVVDGLGYHAWALAAGAWLLVLGHGSLLLAAAGQLRESPGSAWTLMAITWVSGLSSGLFVFRLLGVWWHHLHTSRETSTHAAARV